MKLMELVNEHYDDLNSNDLHIWRFISNHSEKCCHMSITELANECNVSRTSILRFTQKISLEGFSELKFHLRNEQVSNSNLNEHIISDVCNDYMKSMDYTNSQNMKEACKLIHNANHIFAFGSGEMQQLAIMHLKNMFYKTGIFINLVYGSSERENMLQNVQENDIIFLFSYGGESKVIVDFALECKKKNYKIISLTNLKENSLSRLADAPLFFLTSFSRIPIGKMTFAPGGMFFIIAEMLFLQYILYLKELETD